MLMPPIFTNFALGTVIASFTIKMGAAPLAVTLPIVDYAPDTFADLIVVNTPASGVTATFINTRVDASQALYKLDLIAVMPYTFSVQTMEISLTNTEGTSNPYYIQIRVQDTPPEFTGKTDLSKIGSCSVEIG
jgi:hypothetical protein